MRGKYVLRIAATAAIATIVMAVAKIIIDGTSLDVTVRSTSAPRVLDGGQVVVVLLITESCSAARRDDFKRSLRTGLEMVRKNAQMRGYTTSLIGVALSANSSATRRFIAELAPFDQLIVGSGWLNSGAVNYVWRDFEGSPTVPQLVLLYRRVEVSQNEIAVSPDSLLFRLAGADDIMRWTNAGAPIDLQLN
jgi:hypothetical protein